MRIVREGHQGLVVLLFRQKRPCQETMQRFQQTENVVLKLPSPRTSVPFLNALAHPKLDTPAELESPAYAYTRFLRYLFWDTPCRI